eukprot:TRINITY_DN2117_c0_g1_i4.p1 TRINITY_DN2117_c0_g1~~TRINITY_DN2117_c0_g1_i4.p1  ORF type:complete len:273 (-),score=52.99 TRINITY_DN2117_c0_g1_i4:310-1128(-)
MCIRDSQRRVHGDLFLWQDSKITTKPSRPIHQQFQHASAKEMYATDLFNTHDKEFTNTINQADKQIDKLASMPFEQKKNEFQSLRKMLTNAKNSLDEMENEFARADGRESERSLQKRLRECRDRYQEVKKKLDQGEQRYLEQEQQKNIFGSKSTKDNGGTLEDKARYKLLNNQDKLVKQDDKLEDIKKIAYETENIAIDTSNNLKMQRDVIVKANNTAKDIESNLKQTDRLTSELSWGQLKIKITLIFLAFLLFVVIIVLTLAKVGVFRSSK